MKKTIFLIFLVTVARQILAQYQPIDNKSSVRFSIKNFGIPVSGSFTGMEANIDFDAAHPEQATFKVTIKAGTVNTGNELRDNHLRKEDYFDTEHFPTITFSSSRTMHGKDGILVVYGMLGIKGHVREIAIPFDAVAGGGGYLFKGTFVINRKDFAIGGSSIIGENAVIDLSVTTQKK